MIRENCLYSVNHFNKTLIGQAGSIGGKARQEVGVEQRNWEYFGKTGSSLRQFCPDHRRGKM